MKKLLLLLLFGASWLSAQPATPVFRTVATLPSTCSVGQGIYKTGSGAGQYNCKVINTWTLVGGGTGSVASVSCNSANNCTVATGTTTPVITVTGFDGVAVTGTPTSGQVPTATSGTAATWQTPSSGSSPSGALGQVQLYATSSTFGSDPHFNDLMGAGGEQVVIVGPPTAIDITGDTGEQFEILDDAFSYAEMVGAGHGGTEIDFFVSGGTLASPTAAADGDQIFSLSGSVYHGTAFSNALGEIYNAAQDLGGGIFGSFLELQNAQTPNVRRTLYRNSSRNWHTTIGAHGTFSSADTDNDSTLTVEDKTGNAVTTHIIRAGVAQSNTDLMEWQDSSKNVMAQIDSGGGLHLDTDIANPLTMAKTTQSASAPGAGKADMRWIAGTNMGTCKLVTNAGTSATEVTIIDNVGSGC